MKRILLALALVLAFAGVACAQYSTVSGTITDPNGTSYYSGNLTISLINNSGQQATLGGNPVLQTVYETALDSTGSFSLTLPRNDQMVPTTTQWNFQVTAKGGYAGFNVSITINSGSQSVSTAISAAAVRISWPVGSVIRPSCAPGQPDVAISATLEGCANGQVTGTNCNQNTTSPAACGSATAGVVVVPTTTVTYTVNSTAVTANSRIQVVPITDNSGVSGSPTCNTPPTPFIAYQSGRTAGTSFTFTLPSTTGTSCWVFEIID